MPSSCISGRVVVIWSGGYDYPYMEAFLLDDLISVTLSEVSICPAPELAAIDTWHVIYRFKNIDSATGPLKRALVFKSYGEAADNYMQAVNGLAQNKLGERIHFYNGKLYEELQEKALFGGWHWTVAGIIAFCAIGVAYLHA